MKKSKPLVGVSQCLLGDAVRYDGQSKANIIVIEQLGKIFDLFPVCPEVEAGLSIPRPAVQLNGNIDKPKLIGRDDPSIDITDIMQHYCENKPAKLSKLSGFIFKSRSPSCGLNTTPVFIDGKCISETSRGVFARCLTDYFKKLPVIEDSEINSNKLNNFIDAVNNYSPTSIHSEPAEE